MVHLSSLPVQILVSQSNDRTPYDHVSLDWQLQSFATLYLPGEQTTGTEAAGAGIEV